MLTDSELNEMEGRCNGAQRGPRMDGISEHRQIVIITHVETAVRINAGLLPPEIRHRLPEWNLEDENGYIKPCREAEFYRTEQQTFEFIAHSRSDIPKLIAEIRRLQVGLKN